MSLRLTDEYDPEDWDVYRGKGPMRTVMHYVCEGCDKTRCHLVVETAQSEELGVPRSMVFDREVRMPCPLERCAVFLRDADPEEHGWAGTRYGSREERDRKEREGFGR